MLAVLVVLAAAAEAMARAGGGSAGAGGGGSSSGGGGGAGGGSAGGGVGGRGGYSGGGAGDGSSEAEDPRRLLIISLVFVAIWIVTSPRVRGAVAYWRWRVHGAFAYWTRRAREAFTACWVRRKRSKRIGRVRLAAAEAADDDPAFASDDVERRASELFVACQRAWNLRDGPELARLVGRDLLVEWERRLDDYMRKGWHNRVAVRGAPQAAYVGLVRRGNDEEDRVVVEIRARLEDYTLDRYNNRVASERGRRKTTRMCEYWTLGKREGLWIVASIEQALEGLHQLDAEIVASPASDPRIADEALVEAAVEDRLPAGLAPADVSDLEFGGDARAVALDLSLADGRFAPDVLEAAARRAVEAWAEAVDGDDGRLKALASPNAVRHLLHPDDASMKRRMVVRGPRVRRIRIEEVDARGEPATMTIEIEIRGRRYVEDRDTTAVLTGSRNVTRIFSERWTMALDGPDSAPWRVIDVAAGTRSAAI